MLFVHGHTGLSFRISPKPVVIGQLVDKPQACQQLRQAQFANTQRSQQVLLVIDILERYAARDRRVH